MAVGTKLDTMSYVGLYYTSAPSGVQTPSFTITITFWKRPWCNWDRPML